MYFIRSCVVHSKNLPNFRRIRVHVDLRPQYRYHLEFTVQEGHLPGRAPTQDNLLVFYLPSKGDWDQAINRMEKQGFEATKSWNPWWDIKGKTFEDPDGWRVVLWHGEWKPASAGI